MTGTLAGTEAMLTGTVAGTGTVPGAMLTGTLAGTGAMLTGTGAGTEAMLAVNARRLPAGRQARAGTGTVAGTETVAGTGLTSGSLHDSSRRSQAATAAGVMTVSHHAGMTAAVEAKSQLAGIGSQAVAGTVAGTGGMRAVSVSAHRAGMQSQWAGTGSAAAAAGMQRRRRHVVMTGGSGSSSSSDGQMVGIGVVAVGMRAEVGMMRGGGGPAAAAAAGV
jgi:hypothetical protein